MLGALRVMRPPVAAWSPLDLPDLVAWYDASNTASITESGGVVSQLDDLSGHGLHLSQATSAHRPTLTTINGLSALQFTNASDPAQKLVNASFTSTTQPFYVFLVATFTGTANNNTVLSWLVDSGVWIRARGPGTGAAAGAAELVASNGDNVMTGSTVFSSSAAQVTAFGNGASSVIRANSGAITDSGDAGSNRLGGSFYMGAYFGFPDAVSLAWVGAVGEVIVCGSDIGTTHRDTAETALSAKWGV